MVRPHVAELAVAQAEIVERMRSEQAETLARIERDLAERRTEEQRLARRGRWRR